MNTKIIKHILVALFISLSFNIFAQSFEFYQFKLEKETKVIGNKIYYKGLVNKGKESQIDVNAMVEKHLINLFRTYPGNKEKKIQNLNTWTLNPLFDKVESASEADVIIGGNYTIKTETKIEEKLLYERAKNVGGAIPYYEIRQINSAKISIIISYTYKDKSVKYDTLISEYSYERKPNTSFQSIDKLLEKCRESINIKIFSNFKFIAYEGSWYNFKQVKTKDKALKEELKSAKDLLEAGDIKKLANIYLKIYQKENTNLEAIFNLALCYELIGNYPKANELYLKSPDFHAKVRMKENMKLYDYLIDIKANIKLEEL